MRSLSKEIGVCVGLWIGTFLYFFIAHPHMLIATIVDYCWYESVGVLSIGFVNAFIGNYKSVHK